MGKIVACIDASAYADSICHLSAWASKNTGLSISLLHVVSPHFDVEKNIDLSGQIGLGANTNLLEELAKLDEENGKLEQKKGRLMLEHAKAELVAEGIPQAETLHRRGSLVETIMEMEANIALVVMGKRGEHADTSLGHLGSNFERVARAIHKPLLVATKTVSPITRFLIAYDGSPSAQKAVEYISTDTLLKGLECHLLKVGDETTSESEAILKQAQGKLTAAGFKVQADFISGKSVQDAVSAAISEHSIDLLVIGAYGHSKLRSLVLGSTTTALIRKSQVPVLLFR